MPSASNQVQNNHNHLRNHGFLGQGQQGWTLSPAYDINPTSAEIKLRILSANIDFDDDTCSVEILHTAAAELP